jgi:hypothetical protein
MSGTLIIRFGKGVIMYETPNGFATWTVYSPRTGGVSFWERHLAQAFAEREAARYGTPRYV